MDKYTDDSASSADLVTVKARLRECIDECTSAATGKSGGSDAAFLARKKKFIDALIRDIDPDAGSCWKSWDEEARHLALTLIKIMSRDKESCKIIYEEIGVTVLMRHSDLLSTFVEDVRQRSAEEKRGVVTVEALKCLCNSLLQVPSTVAIFEKNDGPNALIRNLRKHDEHSTDFIFLYSRLLFLCTANSTSIVSAIVENCNSVEAIEQCLSGEVAKAIQPSDRKGSDATPAAGIFTSAMSTSELLKTIFNLQHFYSSPTGPAGSGSNESHFESFLPHILHVINSFPLPTPLPLAPPISHAVHALINLPVKLHSDRWFPDGDLATVTRLVTILRTSLEHQLPGGGKGKSYDEDAARPEADEILPPLLLVLVRVAKEWEPARKMLKEVCLPGTNERNVPVDKGVSLSARLIRLMTGVRFPQLKEATSTFMYTICDEDAGEFVHCVGYGNAAGYLVMNNIPFVGPTHAPSDDSSRPFNAITGQYIDQSAAAQEDLAKMTEEEKEREAEKLFVLFERLNKTGVIKAKNPIGEAIRDGKI